MKIIKHLSSCVEKQAFLSRRVFEKIAINPTDAIGGPALWKVFSGIPWALLVLACRTCLVVTGKSRAEDSSRHV